jgi:spermine oxidase
MVVKKPKIVIIGAGMAGLTAANKLYTSTASKDLFELIVVEGGTRIGGRINTSEFGGDKIEMGATWIHGIGNSPIHKIAQQTNSLQSTQPWECMDGNNNDESIITIAEGGFHLQPFIVDPITKLFKYLMDYSQGKLTKESAKGEILNYYNMASKASSRTSSSSNFVSKKNHLSIGSFLRQGLDAYFETMKEQEEVKGCEEDMNNWNKKLLQEAVFAMYENTERTYTSAGDLESLDYEAESEYRMFPGEEITIAKGYLSIIENIASVLPNGLVQLGRKVKKIEWQMQKKSDDDHSFRPVKLHFYDGSVMYADHVIVTVSLGVLKASINHNHDDDDDGDNDEEKGMYFCPKLPSFKVEAISRLGFGVVNKLFIQMNDENSKGLFPFLQMVFHSSQNETRDKKIPWWMRKTATLFPIYNNSSVLLSWFAGEEALELEKLKDEEIINGVSATVSNFLPHSSSISKVLKSKWGTDPLFLGSYSYVAVGSSGEDLDTMAEPLPLMKDNSNSNTFSYPLQILFAGEATHRTHYSTTHGAYFSGLREANRLLQHYHCVGIFNN